jgi:hypothetical protein
LKGELLCRQKGAFQLIRNLPVKLDPWEKSMLFEQRLKETLTQAEKCSQVKIFA